MNEISALHSWAIYYSQTLKLPIFPLMPGTKVPLTKNGFKDATRDLPTINGWWTRFPSANIGCATGCESGIVVLDIDAKPDAHSVLKEFEKRFGDVPSTQMAASGGGGFHFFYSSSKSICTRNKIIQGVDFKADGGYIVLPPSVHPSGRSYEWMNPPSEGIRFSELSDELLKVVDKDNGTQPKQTSHFYLLHFGDVQDGDRTDTLTSMIGHLLARKVEPLLVREIALAVNASKFKPPLPQDKILKTLNSFAGRELKKRRAFHG